MELNGVKDVSELHLASETSGRFKEGLRAAFGRVALWTDLERSESEARARETWEACERLAHERRILDVFADTLRHSGVAGDFARWGRLGGLETLRRYGRPWFALLARRRWKKVGAEALDLYRAEQLAAKAGTVC